MHEPPTNGLASCGVYARRKFCGNLKFYRPSEHLRSPARTPSRQPLAASLRTVQHNKLRIILKIKKMDRKRQEIMSFLHERVFGTILNSANASNSAKRGVRLTIMRMEQLSAAGMRQYFWSAIAGKGNAISFADLLSREGFVRFEEVLEDFRERFTDDWQRQKQATMFFLINIINKICCL